MILHLVDCLVRQLAAASNVDAKRAIKSELFLLCAIRNGSLKWIVSSNGENISLLGTMEIELGVRFIPFIHSSTLKLRNFLVGFSTSGEDGCQHVNSKCDLPDASCSSSLVLVT